MCDYESIKRNIRVVSDIHLEHYMDLPNFRDIITPNKSDILCLLGDIGNPFKDSYKSFLVWCKENFGIVLLITGNHEYYGSSLEDTNEYINSLCKSLGIFFLNNGVFVYKNIAFLGTTLWSYIPEELYPMISNRMNDYHLIEDFTPSVSTKLFKENLKWLIDTINRLKNENFKIIVMTHHTPSSKDTSFYLYEKELQNCAFSTDLPELIQKVDMWMYGHTHFNNKDNVVWKYDKPLVSNQRGYPGKLVEGYNKDFTIYIND